MTFRYLIIGAAALILAACGADTKDVSTEGVDTKISESAPKLPEKTPEMDHSKIVTGNGVNNFITLEGARRTGGTFTFPEVTLSKDGFLVFHPFRDGKPVQTEYVAAKHLTGGSHKNVAIDVAGYPQTGDMFIVMLHFDMNEDGIFDFNGGVDVPDAPVFEDNTLVALTYKTPQSR